MSSKPITISENAHSLIMKDMIKYLDECKIAKADCQCSGVLKYNPMEKDEYKKWKFLYQCDDSKSQVNHMEQVTGIMAKTDKDYKVQVYKVDKN